MTRKRRTTGDKRNNVSNALLHALAGRDDSFADRAYKELEHQIVTAQIKPGEWVTEVALSEQLGISRTPIREALQRLARARLLEIVPRRGLRITEVNVGDQLLLLEFRREAERYLVGRAANCATDHERALFRRLAKEMQRSGGLTDVTEHYRVDLEFKLLLVRASRNDYAADAVAPMWSLSRRFAWVTRFERNVALSADLTAKVMIAIANGDEQAARNANDAYIDALASLARASLEPFLNPKGKTERTVA